MADYQTIRFDIADNIARLTLNRPERLNACSLDMADEMMDALDRLDGARVLVLTGEGRAFCSGADLAARGDRPVNGGQGSYAALATRYNPLMMKLARLDIPVISAVNGPAAGVGCSIALVADFVIAAESGYFLQAFVNIGLVPDGGASWMLPRLVGKARATQMMMLGEKIGAAQAQDWGMIYKAVADDQLTGEVVALAQRLATGPTVAYGAMRRNLLTALEASFAEALNAEAEGQRLAGSSADAAEGGMAFLAKRKPTFKGK
ncbi:enoyl-CoA hydratase-related protein [Alteripontixanthobacter muriae]|uniref:enoyl-CoA hydratase-related protein n=1 Tax=Alteripontixanthobacter muriae TaxID=2705546 RepID=UPI001576635D|nr:enoyl-CoA hydratase-related protein [Alteripontixanthobacter muriae]